MLKRADRNSGDLLEVREIVQSTLEKVRSLSHALHPVILDEIGLESALDVYLPDFERQTGIAIRYEKSGPVRELNSEISIHLYRVMQEALSNVARHSGSKCVAVRLRFVGDAVMLEVEDEGAGFPEGAKNGLGLVSMRERAELLRGDIEYLRGSAGGALVRVRVPLALAEAHV
jgi:signal transduction histidine kinase